MSVTGITSKQRFAFFRALSAACQNLGLNTQEERDTYRKQVMREECKKEHLALLNRTTDYDRCMSRFARDAGDWQTASKFASGDAYRLAVMIRICCQQIMQLKGLPDGSDATRNYLAGILEQSRIACGTHCDDSSFWMDVSQGSLLVVFQILDTHRRRILAGYAGAGLEGFRGFDERMVYTVNPRGGVQIRFDKAYYDSYNSIRVNVQAS